MALTKVTGQVIKNTTDVTVGVLTVTNTLAVGGTVSIGGTLTYEDVTNVDAVGLITARNGIVVGSGITLSKDGDGFFTGVITATSYSGIDLSDVTGATGDFSIADKIVHTGDTNTALRFPAADTVTAETGGSERLRITSDGKIGINETSPAHRLVVGGDIGVGFNTPNDAARQINFNVNRGSAGDTLANINWQWNDKYVAQIRGIAGADTTNKDDAHLAFFTSAANNLVERLRITSAGLFGIGTNAPTSTLYVNGTSSNDVITARAADSNGVSVINILAEGTTGHSRIKLSDTAGTDGQISYSHNDRALIFAAGGTTERLRIDSSGRLGIQGAATKGVLDVRASGGSATMLTAVFGANEGTTAGTLSDNTDKGARVGLYHYDTDEEPYSLFSSGATSSANSINFGGGTGLMNAATSLGFYTAANTTTTTGTKRMDISSSGNVTINTGNLIIGTSGKGIDFSADGNASGQTSELFDDYEEGTWNVTSFNYDYDGNQAQRGHYIKVGRVVHAFFRVKFHNQSTYTGQHLRFTGLPFTSANGNPYDLNVGGVAHGYSHIDFFRIYVQPGSTYAYWYTETGSNFNNSTSLNNKDVRGCITYTASS